MFVNVCYLDVGKIGLKY